MPLPMHMTCSCSTSSQQMSPTSHPRTPIVTFFGKIRLSNFTLKSFRAKWPVADSLFFHQNSSSVRWHILLNTQVNYRLFQISKQYVLQMWPILDYMYPSEPTCGRTRCQKCIYDHSTPKCRPPLCNIKRNSHFCQHVAHLTPTCRPPLCNSSHMCQKMR